MTALRPLVVEVARCSFVWVQQGRGWLLHTSSRTWVPLEESPGIGGRVLGVVQTAALVEIFGAPTEATCT